MKAALTSGIITSKLAASRDFYTGILGFKVVYESDWFLLLSTADGGQHISFLQPDHPSQQPVFQPAFTGKGVYLTLEVENVDAEWDRIQQLDVPVLINLRSEDWGDRHFALLDPNGIGVDIVTYQAPAS